MHGGVRGFLPPSNPGCYVTKFAPQKGLKLIACRKLTFHKRVVLHRVEINQQIKWGAGLPHLHENAPL